MAEEVEMTPVEMTPVAAEPPKVNPLAKPGATVSALRPGLKLPPKPGATVSALKPGLKLPPKPGATVAALRPGLKLPPKPGATVSALKPGLKLPPKPGATVSALKPGLKLPPKPGLAVPPKPGVAAEAKPLIHKPGEGPAATSLPKPLPKPVVPVDAQGVGKLPTVEAKAISRDEAVAPVEVPKPLETLKSVTQKLKGITQQIPPQAILHKTGIIAEPSATTDAQKEAAKHKTARISLSDAMGVAPVKDEPAPMKTIRIKRPVNLPGVTPAASGSAPAVSATATAPEAKKEAESAPTAPAAAPKEPAVSVTQRKTLKISRPGTAVRPSKFGVKRPGAQPAAAAKASAAAGAQPAPEGEVADIPDLPPVSADVPAFQPVAEESKPGVGTTLAVVFKLVATVVIGALAWFLYENAQLPTYCGGLGWGQ